MPIGTTGIQVAGQNSDSSYFMTYSIMVGQTYTGYYFADKKQLSLTYINLPNYGFVAPSFFNTPFLGYVSSCSYNGKIYFFGGCIYNSPYTPFPHLFVWDPRTNIFTQLADAPTALASGGICGDSIGNIYILGGTDVNKTSQSTVQSYNIYTNTWTTRTSMPVPIYGSWCILNDVIYTIMGQTLVNNSGTAPLQTVYAYYTLTDTWVQLPNIPYTALYTGYGGLLGNTVFSYNGLVYTLNGEDTDGHGGGNAAGTTGLMMSYNPISQAWNTLPQTPMNTTTNAYCTIMGNKLFAQPQFNGTIYCYDFTQQSWTSVYGSAINDANGPNNTQCGYMPVGFTGFGLV